MNQSLKELKKKDKDAYHEYVKWNHLDDAKSRIAEETHQRVAIVYTLVFLLRFYFYYTLISYYKFICGMYYLSLFKF